MSVSCDESLLSRLERAEPTLIWSFGGTPVFAQSRYLISHVDPVIFVIWDAVIYSFWFEFPERNAKNLQRLSWGIPSGACHLRCWKINLRSIWQARRSARTEWLSYSGGLSAIQIVLQFIAGLNGMWAYQCGLVINIDMQSTFISNPHCMLGLPFL